MEENRRLPEPFLGRDREQHTCVYISVTQITSWNQMLFRQILKMPGAIPLSSDLTRGGSVTEVKQDWKERSELI